VDKPNLQSRVLFNQVKFSDSWRSFWIFYN
jgi:hypothetical protein